MTRGLDDCDALLCRYRWRYNLVSRRYGPAPHTLLDKHLTGQPSR